MSFLSPLFLLGLAAIAAPVLVHLVRRTRARRVEFPALRFVRQVPQRTIRRRTLHNLLLLLLRCLAVLLVVFAFTRPFFSGAGAAEESVTGRASVVLLDASLSMRRDGLFDEAKRRAEALVGEMPADERVAVVTFGERYEVAGGFTTDRAQTRAALSSSTAGFEATDYEQALRGADALLGEIKDAGARRVFLISDFQAGGWDASRATFKLRADAWLGLIDVGGESAANLAVTRVEARSNVYGQKYADRVAVHIANFSDDERKGLALDFEINDQTVEKRELHLAPREERVVEFTGFNLAEGPNRCAVRLRADDFPHDNDFLFTLRRNAPGKALIIDPAARGRGESFYLQSALSTGGGLPYTFDVKGTGEVNPSDIASHALVILNDPGTLSAALAESLAAFAESGGPVVIATGPRTRPESFNQSLGRIAPALLNEAVQLRPGESLRLSDVNTSHPVFEVFRGATGGRLSSARVFGYTSVEPREGAQVLARFEDGRPALVESGASAKGRVLMFTTTFGMSWNDLPLAPSFLPLVQQMVRYLGERESSAWHRLGETFTVGREAGGEPPAVDSPSGARLKEGARTPEGDLLLTAREPGFYRLRYDSAHDFAAVNVEGREGDFTKLNTEEFLAAVTGGDANARAGDHAGAGEGREELEARQRVWWPLLALALMLFAAETLLARRTKMVRQIG